MTVTADGEADHQAKTHYDDVDGTAPGGPGLWRRRWRWIFAGLIVVVAVPIAVRIAGSDDTDDATRRDEDQTQPTPPPPVDTQLDGEANELLALLEAGSERTYHAIYDVDGEPDVIGNELRVEVWRSNGLVRQDLHQETGAAIIDVSTFVLADEEIVACQRLDEGDWSCARQATSDEFTTAGLFGTIARELEGADVIATDEEVVDRPARCFAVNGLSGEVSQCMSEDGIPLRQRGGGAELVLAELSDEVQSGVFTPPAEPVSGP